MPSSTSRRQRLQTPALPLPRPPGNRCKKAGLRWRLLGGGLRRPAPGGVTTPHSQRGVGRSKRLAPMPSSDPPHRRLPPGVLVQGPTPCRAVPAGGLCEPVPQRGSIKEPDSVKAGAFFLIGPRPAPSGHCPHPAVRWKRENPHPLSPRRGVAGASPCSGLAPRAIWAPLAVSSRLSEIHSVQELEVNAALLSPRRNTVVPCCMRPPGVIGRPGGPPAGRL